MGPPQPFGAEVLTIQENVDSGCQDRWAFVHSGLCWEQVARVCLLRLGQLLGSCPGHGHVCLDLTGDFPGGMEGTG